MSEATFDPRPLIARVEWRQARSVPRFPHWYFVQPRGDADDFFAFADLINKQGEPRHFGKTRYRYLEIGEHTSTGSADRCTTATRWSSTAGSPPTIRERDSMARTTPEPQR